MFIITGITNLRIWIIKWNDGDDVASIKRQFVNIVSHVTMRRFHLNMAITGKHTTPQCLHPDKSIFQLVACTTIHEIL